ncbi:MAG: hypothetical protein O2930_16055, partial [Acidobacteria bacterium]|nr:hypothetical protein [Acidobacteriota bacterium]
MPYGKPGTNRLNVGARITVPASVRDRFDGLDVTDTNELVLRNTIWRIPIHKVNLRLSKCITMGRIRVTSLTEAFNLFNRKIACTYVPQVDAADFGRPSGTAGNAYVPRSGQLGLRVDFDHR